MEENVRKEVIPELDQLRARASELQKELDYLLGRHNLYKDEELASALSTAGKLVSTLRGASDALKGNGADWIREYITGWYRDMHYDIHPVVEMPEEDITDPVYKSITYKGENTWEIIMITPTHGRERVVVHSDTATWEEVYSADRIESE
jgi:hypothetical protein